MAQMKSPGRKLPALTVKQALQEAEEDEQAALDEFNSLFDSDEDDLDYSRKHQEA